MLILINLHSTKTSELAPLTTINNTERLLSSRFFLGLGLVQSFLRAQFSNQIAVDRGPQCILNDAIFGDAGAIIAVPFFKGFEDQREPGIFSHQFGVGQGEIPRISDG